MARSFDDGSSQYLQVGSAVISGPPFTMAAWVNSDDAAADQCVLCVADTSSASDFQFLYLAGGTAGDPVCMGSLESGGPSSAVTTSGFSTGTWHHACGIVAAADDRSAFIDGGSKGTDSNSEAPVGLDGTSIGRICDSSPTYYFSGSIAEAAIWNVALSDAEVAVLAAGFSPLFVRPENLVAYWPLIRDTDDDVVGGYSMTAGGTPTVASHPPVLGPAPVMTAVTAGAAPPVTAALPVLSGGEGVHSLVFGGVTVR